MSGTARRPPLQALTVRQPWASLLARGVKPLENRSWAPPAALLGGYLAIHAGKAVDHEDWEAAFTIASNAGQLAAVPWLHEIARALDDFYEREPAAAAARVDKWLREPAQRACPHGAIVAVARLVDVAHDMRDPWYVPGACAWVLADVVPIDPVWVDGAQGLWTVPPDALAEVREFWRAATRGG